jgi:proteasome accessory factor A
MPVVALADPVAALRSMSRTLHPQWRVILADGSTADALTLLRQYHRKAKQMFHGRDAESDAILRLWGQTLDGLAENPDSLMGLIDWSTKQFILGQFCESENLDWTDPWLESQDLEFHQINPNRSLGLTLANCDGFWNPLNLEQAKREAPGNSRAHARSRLMREIQGLGCSYHVDWAEVAGPNEQHSLLPNPCQA